MHPLPCFRPFYQHTFHEHLRGEAAKGSYRLQGYGDCSLEPLLPPKGPINAHSNINNIFLQDLDIPKLHNVNRDLTSPILNLDQNFKITIPGVNWSTLVAHNIIDNTPPHYITCYTDRSKPESLTPSRSLSPAPRLLLKQSLPLYGKPATPYLGEHAPFNLD